MNDSGKFKIGGYEKLDETELLHAMHDNAVVADINREYFVRGRDNPSAKKGLQYLGPVLGDGGPALKEVVIANQVAMPALGESVRVIPVEAPATSAVAIPVHAQTA